MLVSLLIVLGMNAQNPKREFRGAWIQCVNGQYLGKSMAQIRQMLSSQLDILAGRWHQCYHVSGKSRGRCSVSVIVRTLVTLPDWSTGLGSTGWLGSSGLDGRGMS